MDYKKPQSTIVHGGAGIYPLTTADQVILADGSRLEKDGKISADSAANSAKLGGKAPEHYLQPRNLLDNSDFTNPVNQRGQTSYTGEVYTIDRWRLWDEDTLTVNDGYISVSRSIYQYIDLSNLENKNYTLAACKIDGSIICLTNNPYSAYVWSNGIGLGTNDGKLAIISIDNGNYVWAALYEGSYTADTLPPYVPKGYAAEFAECRRYYKRFTSPYAALFNAGYVTSSAKNIYINPLDNYPMRKNKPSCAFRGTITVRGIKGYVAENYSDVVIGVYEEVTGCVSALLIKRGDLSAWNATNNTPVTVQIMGDSVLELIADL